MYTYDSREQAMAKTEQLTRQNIRTPLIKGNRECIGFSVEPYPNGTDDRQSWKFGIIPLCKYIDIKVSNSTQGHFIAVHLPFNEIELV